MRACPRCGESSDDRGRFCWSCGAALRQTAPEAREARKVVTVLFCDMVGSTALSDRKDPEFLQWIMSRYFGAMRAIIEHHGGTVAKFVGDAVMGVFGTPVLHEDDALRAVRAAAQMQQALDGLNAELEPSVDVRVEVRIGINTGRVERHGGLYDALTRRKTTRRWDRSATIGAEELATVLYYVFGCHGNAPMAGGSLILKRTSPSGGGLHPIEAYPLVSGVDGIDPGLYHYDGLDHSLELIAAVDSDEATEIAAQFVCGQRFLASAHVLVAMTALFYRSFWKYRRHQKAYSALMMDAAHLSQTLYLVATEMGLGAFVTAAINGANIEERLKLDGFTEGAVAVAGFGKRSSRASPLEPRYAPHVPAAPT